MSMTQEQFTNLPIGTTIREINTQYEWVKEDVNHWEPTVAPQELMAIYRQAQTVLPGGAPFRDDMFTQFDNYEIVTEVAA